MLLAPVTVAEAPWTVMPTLAPDTVTPLIPPPSDAKHDWYWFEHDVA
jgi:hypothetical protein